MDKAMTVIDLASKQVLATVPVPADLTVGFKPHDITVTPTGAIVTLLQTGGEGSGWLVQYSGATFQETNRLEVGDDPHVMYWGFQGSSLYVASQTSDEVLRLDPDDLSVTGRLPVTGAHGIWADEDETRLFVTNIEAGGGTDGLHVINIADGAFEAVAGSPVDTRFSFPHNVTSSRNADRLFVTHGSNDFEFTSAYDLDADGLPTSSSAIRTGATAFGTVFVPDPFCAGNLSTP